MMWNYHLTNRMHSQRFCRIPRGPTLTFKIQQVLKINFYTFIIAWFAINLKAMLEVLTLGVRPEKYFLLSAGDYIMFVCEMYVWVGGNIVILRVKILFKILVRKGVYVYRPLATFITVLLVLYYFGCLYYFITYTRVAINSLFFS